jgi:hypothetical protein
MTQTDKAVADPDVDLFAGMKKKKKKQVAHLPHHQTRPTRPPLPQLRNPLPLQLLSPRREINLEMRNQRLRRRHQWPMRELSYLEI